MENTETLIVEQLKIGNENAYRYIYDHHYALLCYVANGYLKDQFLSETIVGGFARYKNDSIFKYLIVYISSGILLTELPC